MTATAVSTSTFSAPVAWDEPEGIAPRGTLLVLPGRGDSPAAYGRFGRRLSTDAYKVRVVEVALDDLATTKAHLEQLLADEELPSPKVLVGTDTGAAIAATLVEDLAVDAVVLAGLVLPSGDRAEPADWDAELEARSACPAHRRVITEDDEFQRGALTQPVPESLVPVATTKPVLVVHGSADPVTLAADAFDLYRHSPRAQLRLVTGGRHDVLNDLSHRSVAATVVLFLERLKLGEDAPAIVSAPLNAGKAS